jgi:hypothetical protein
MIYEHPTRGSSFVFGVLTGSITRKLLERCENKTFFNKYNLFVAEGWLQRAN